MRKSRLFIPALLVFISLLSLYPTVLAKPKDDKVPPAPEDYWNYEAAEPTSVDPDAPAYNLHVQQMTTLSESKDASILLASGCYLAGASTTKDTDGIRINELYVTNPSVSHPSDDFFAAWILVEDDPGMNWFQVGWVENGRKGNKQIIFVQHGWGSVSTNEKDILL